MKLRNKLIATIVSISMVLAVIGVGAWASTESFTATITNTVNLEFDNLKGQIVAMGVAGADNLDEADGPDMEEVLYDGSNVIYNQISSSATNGTNLYWEGTKFLDSSEGGMQGVDNETTAAVLSYWFVYFPTDDCVGTSTITAMVTETSAPEISGGKLMVKYFATVDEVNYTEITSGQAITPVADNEVMAIVAVCQYYNLDGESITSIASAWDFNVTFTAGRNEKTALPGGAMLDVDPSDGIILPYDYDGATTFNHLKVANRAGFDVDNVKGDVTLVGVSGANNVDAEAAPIVGEILLTDPDNTYNQISSYGTTDSNLYWDGAAFLDDSDYGLQLVNKETTAAAILYGLIYEPTEDCNGENTITVIVDEIGAPVIDGGVLFTKYFVSKDMESWTELAPGEAATPILDNEAMMIAAVCQYYNIYGDSVSTIASAWNFNVALTAGSEEITPLTGSAEFDADIEAILSSGAAVPYLYEAGHPDIWEIIEMGEYPQTLKASNVNIVSETPDADGYYLGDDGERYAKRTMKYHKFISHNANTFNTNLASDGTLMEEGEDYYFKVEPVKWRVLSDEGGRALIVSDLVLDWGGENRSFSYAGSELRSFLVNDFYNSAFSESEQSAILTTEVDNSKAYQFVQDGSDKPEGLIQNSATGSGLQDKVFALSVEELQNEEYGFGVDGSGYWGVTDYAKAAGVLTATREWYEGWGLSGAALITLFSPSFGSGTITTRTPGYVLFPESEEWTTVEFSNGAFGHTWDMKYYGVAPAMYISR